MYPSWGSGDFQIRDKIIKKSSSEIEITRMPSIATMYTWSTAFVKGKRKGVMIKANEHTRASGTVQCEPYLGRAHAIGSWCTVCSTSGPLLLFLPLFFIFIFYFATFFPFFIHRNRNRIVIHQKNSKIVFLFKDLLDMSQTPFLTLGTFCVSAKQINIKCKSSLSRQVFKSNSWLKEGSSRNLGITKELGK